MTVRPGRPSGRPGRPRCFSGVSADRAARESKETRERRNLPALGENVRRQPSLHEHLTCVAAPATWLSPPGGQLTGGVDGLYVSDRRVLSRLLVTIDGTEPEPRAPNPRCGRVRFTAIHGALTVERLRTVRRDGGTEQVTIRNAAGRPRSRRALARRGGRLGPDQRRQGGRPAPAGESVCATAPSWPASTAMRYRLEVRRTSSWSWSPAGTSPRPSPYAPGRRRPRLPPRGAGRPAALGRRAPGRTLRPTSRLDALVAQGVADLGALLLADEGDLYCAAGSPWYLTLFGRDALWAARLALPLGTELAAGTLRALARHQGTGHDPVTEEEPGKIPHELRPAHATRTAAAGLLRIGRRHAAVRDHRWPRRGAGACRPRGPGAAARRRSGPLAWLRPFEEFVSLPGLGRAACPTRAGRTRRRRPARGRHARHAADRAGGGAGVRLPGGHARRGPARRVRHRPATTDRRWAAGLAARFRERFWLDGRATRRSRSTATGRPGRRPRLEHRATCSAPACSTPEEEGRVAERLMDAALRLGPADADRPRRRVRPAVLPPSARSGRTTPRSRCSACAARATRSRRGARARADRAAPAFDYRLPELFGGQDRRDGAVPAPYPPACRPQAWSAAVSPALVTVLLGLDPDVPAGRRTVAPLPGFGEFTVTGVRDRRGRCRPSRSTGTEDGRARARRRAEPPVQALSRRRRRAGVDSVRTPGRSRRRWPRAARWRPSAPPAPGRTRRPRCPARRAR